MKTWEQAANEVMEKYKYAFQALALYDTGLSIDDARIAVLYTKFCAGETTDEEDEKLVEWAEKQIAKSK